MNEKDFGVEERFYQQVAMLLCAEHTYRERPAARRRTNRFEGAGNGRFPPNGLVRMFGPNLIHIALMTPRLSGQFKSPQAALAAIAQAIKDQSETLKDPSN
jgi:hypothetical protein